MYLDWTLVLSALIILSLLYLYLYNQRGLPPGPLGVPILGYWPFLPNTQMHLKFAALKRLYGDVFSFRSTGRLYVHLGTLRAIREYVSKSDCFGKKNEQFSMVRDMFGGGLNFLNGEAWKVNRKFYVSNLKERKHRTLVASEASLYETVARAADELGARSRGEPVDVAEVLFGHCVDTMLGTFFEGGGMPRECVEVVNEYFRRISACFKTPMFMASGPVARYLIFPLTAEYRAAKAVQKKARDHLFKLIDDHESSYDEHATRDLVDDYIRERREKMRRGDPDAKHFTDYDLMCTLVQFVGDSSVTMSTFVSTFLKMAAEHPDEQEKVFSEVERVVGAGRNPTLEDRPRLPYTNAFLAETLRAGVSVFIPAFPSQECVKETTLSGYRIPKGSLIVVDYYTANFDPEIYENPEIFDPTRFLAKEGRRKPDLPKTFGFGKRACVADEFSMLQAFLYVATILKHFRVTIGGRESRMETILTTGHCSLVLHPRSQGLITE